MSAAGTVRPPGDAPPLRFGLICRGTVLPAWQARAVRALRDAGGELVLLVQADSSPVGRAAGRAARLLRHSRADRPVDLGPDLAGVPRLQADEAAAIGAHDLDFLLSLGEAEPDAARARGARHGVWYFAGAAPGIPAAAAGIREIAEGLPTTGVALHRVAGTGEVTVLRAARLKTVRHSLGRTRERALFTAARFPAQVVGALRAGIAVEGTEAMPGAVGEPAEPSVARVLLRQGWGFVAGASRALATADEWGVGIVDAPIAALLDTRPPVRWLPRLGRGRYLADPFALALGEGEPILVEAFDYRRGTGEIAAVWPGRGDAPPEVETIITDEGHHLSYPYLIRHEGAIYCLPETHDRREVRLYRAEEFPRRWTHVATPIAGFAAVDATIFRHEGRWWLASGEQAEPFDTYLYLWYADDLTGPWHPHAANPVKADVRSSRPAGTPFLHEGQLYRPAQDCSHTYGGAIAINRVDRLTPTAFAETTVAVLTPDPDGPYPHGQHTIAACGERTLIDGKRIRPIPQAAMALVRRVGRRG